MQSIWRSLSRNSVNFSVNKFILISRYLEDVKDFYTYTCCSVLSTSFLTVSITLVALASTDWFGAYGFLIAMCFEMLVFCILGTVVQVQVNQISSRKYFTENSYPRPIKSPCNFHYMFNMSILICALCTNNCHFIYSDQRRNSLCFAGERYCEIAACCF